MSLLAVSASLLPVMVPNTVLCTDGYLTYVCLAKANCIPLFALNGGRWSRNTPKSHPISTVNALIGRYLRQPHLRGTDWFACRSQGSLARREALAHLTQVRHAAPSRLRRGSRSAHTARNRPRCYRPPDRRGLISGRENLLLTGPTGLGKSWIGWVLGRKTYRDGRMGAYHRVPCFVSVRSDCYPFQCHGSRSLTLVIL